MTPEFKARKWLEKKAKKGARSYPIGTIAFYGPDNTRASKVSVSIMAEPDSEPEDMRRWFSDTGDVRKDSSVIVEIVDFLHENDVHSVAMVDRLIGCPHEEGIDYPEGEECPSCTYWAGRDRWTGKLLK
ncbi:hypothetical protein ABAC460_19300 [Asticcacaulis sp. AC460]|uniref:hypothetical protein n=1 Tax=Asticcacaulis sp. AC460 TaxID=1282360 RepID=UPI0003C402E9|nr:hypothetical protein [Asticcacaulis sp. AC460]ESQ87475.1 hypothetical protein ABAC460_19300 [Asticcacaulis sp. AC460]